MAQMSCYTKNCYGMAIFCEDCVQRARKQAKADEFKRIQENPTTTLFGLSLDCIRRLIADDESGKKEIQK